MHFVDRLLICSDCQGEFIFTAGEQLFFHDKQFKNDPKRCKPCKSRRSGLAAAAANGAEVQATAFARTETRTECSACGVETTVPFKPTQGRPVLCRQCFQSKNRITAALSSPPHSAQESYSLASVGTPEIAATVSALTEASTNSGGQTLSPAAALLATVSMASASASSSVSSSADLTWISVAPVLPRSSVAARSTYAEPASVALVEVLPAVVAGK